MDREAFAWIARPTPDAASIRVMALPSHDLILIATDPGYPAEMILLDAATGEIRRRFDPKLPKELTDKSTFWFLVGGDSKLYAACNRGLFRYDLEHGLGEKILDVSISTPVVRGKDLFFIRGHELGVVKKVFC